MKTSNEVFNRGIEILRTAFDGTDILILSDLYRRNPDKYCLAGRLGADIWVEGVKIFIGYSEMEDILIYGKHLAEEIIREILKK